MATASSGLPTVEEREGEKDRREARKSRHWNALTAVIASVLTLVLGTVVPAFITAQQEAARSEREFQRDQRAGLYSDFMAAIDESQVLMEPFLPGLFDVGAAMTTVDEYPLVANDDELTQIQDANRQVVSLAGRISVLGGNVTTLADELQQDLRQIENFIEAVKDCHLSNAAGWPCESLSGDLLSSAKGGRSWIAEFSLDRNRFIAATREELSTLD